MNLTAKQEDRRFYVYHLIDPRDGSVFYVGKGTGNRVSQHVRNAVRGRVDNAPKHKRIMQIIRSGHAVIERVVADKMTERAAFQIERQMIAEMRECGITNISGGSVSNIEKAHQQACESLRRIKTFDEWIRSSTVGQMRAAARCGPGGSARAFRDQLVQHLKEIAEMTAPEPAT